jgi:hypothetical protein
MTLYHLFSSIKPNTGNTTGSYNPGSYATCRVTFVCLKASANLISKRKHFMRASLLQSQLDLLQIDEDEGITATVRPKTPLLHTIHHIESQRFNKQATYRYTPLFNITQFM